MASVLRPVAARITLRRPVAVSCAAIKTTILPKTTSPTRRTFLTTTSLLSQKKPAEYSKLWDSADRAVADVKSGSTILSAGFGLCGVAGSLCRHLQTQHGS
jgi:3-oxoacid CoA-transferase